MYETITLLNIFAKRKWLDKKKLMQIETDGVEITNMIKGHINSINKYVN